MMQALPILIRRLGLGLSLALVAAFTMPAAAQSPFSAAVRINDSIVTYYEIDQRARFLEVVRTPGDLREQALEQLVNERLQLQEAERMGVVATPEEIEAGVAEFAARADLGPEQFVRAITGEGVAPETFRDFVANGISWRNVVRSRFGPRGRVSDEEVEQALLLAPRLGSARILLAEIVIPLTPENQENLRPELARLAADLNFDTAAFAEAARRFSAAQTRENGGLTGWRPLSAVPPALREELVLLRAGETWGPVPLGGAIAIFQLRGLQEGSFQGPTITSVDYATIPLPGGQSGDGLAAAAALRADIDVCDDLYGQRPGGFERVDQPLSQIPRDIAMALATLDEGEISFDVVRGAEGTILAVMLCQRTVEAPEDARDQVRAQLTNLRLQSYADGLLEELRADAIIDYDP